MMFGVQICNIDSLLHRICVMNSYYIQQSAGKAVLVLHVIIQSGPKKCIHSLLINIFGINLNEISISG